VKTGTGVKTGGGAARRGRSAAEATEVRPASTVEARRSFFISEEILGWLWPAAF
jgi:hypothetical protein